MKTLFSLFAFALLALPGQALADEAWMTDRGEFIYLSDTDDTAVLQSITSDGETRYYFVGLAGNFQARSAHEGYWISTENFANCGSTMVGKDGFASINWGRATIVFDEPAFPTGWTMLEGFCFDEPKGLIIGDLF